MMGQHDRSEALFYYFCLEDQVPETHLLRLIDKHIRFAFVREKLKESYSDTGRPSIDPELLLRILLIGYLYGIASKTDVPHRACLPATSCRAMKRQGTDYPSMRRTSVAIRCATPQLG